jgi:hypothetical protein
MQVVSISHSHYSLSFIVDFATILHSQFKIIFWTSSGGIAGRRMKQESQKLRAEMKQMQQTPGVESDNPVLAKMAQEIQALKAELADLQDAMAAFQQQTDEPTATPDDVVGLVQSRSNRPMNQRRRRTMSWVWFSPVGRVRLRTRHYIKLRGSK